MAPASITLCRCLRRCLVPPAPRAITLRSRIQPFNRSFSTTIARRADEDKDDFYYKDLIPESEQSAEVQKALRELGDRIPQGFLEKQITSMDPEYKRILFTPKGKRASFWDEFEEDTDYVISSSEDKEPFQEDDIMSLGHAKLEEHREHREYARIAAWQMPLLSKLAKPFEPPTADMPLRFRYTSYLGEFHPAENKVVVEFSPRDLPLDAAQQLKLKKLCGVRYNPETDIVKMSCEQFEHQAQNKRYLGDLVDKLIVEAKDKTDTFEDIPLDTRHHQVKEKPKFPVEWRMTKDRQLQLENAHQQALLLDQAKEKEGGLVDGVQRVEEFLLTTPTRGVAEKVPQLVAAKRSKPLSAKEARRR